MSKNFQKQILTKDVIILLLVAVLGVSADFHGASRVVWLIAVVLNAVSVAVDVWELYHAEK